MHGLWKEHLLVYAGVRISNRSIANYGANSKGKGKEVETDDPPVEELPAIELVLILSSQQKRLVNNFFKEIFLLVAHWESATRNGTALKKS